MREVMSKFNGLAEKVAKVFGTEANLKCNQPCNLIRKKTTDGERRFKVYCTTCKKPTGIGFPVSVLPPTPPPNLR